MSIPRKQIGWSQESNLLWEISNQMEKLTGVVSTSGGGGGGSNLTIKDDGTTLTTAATSIDFTGSGVTATAVGTNVTVDIPGEVINSQCIDLGDSDYTVTEPGVYSIVNANNIFSIIITADPETFKGKTITFINESTDAAALISQTTGNFPIYQGSNIATITQVNAVSTLEIVAVYNSCEYGWRTKPTTAVVTREGIDLYPNLIEPFNPPLYVGIDGGGFYVIDTAGEPNPIPGEPCNSTGVFFPNPAYYNGQRIVIINRDNVCGAYIDPTYAPVTSNLTPLTELSAGAVYEFVATNSQWWVTSIL